MVRILTGLVALCLVLLLSTVPATVAQVSTYDYGLMVDAGSSGTRIHIFTWPRHSAMKVESAPRGSDEPWQLKVSSGVEGGAGGIADFINDPQAAGDSLVELFDYAKEKMAENGGDLSQYSIFLKATAGMRVAYENDPYRTTQVLESCRDALAASGFKFSRENAMIMPGEDEGVFSWLTVNYLLDFPNDGEGVIAADMGGASTQISFSPKEAPLSDSYVLRLEGESSVLYTHSYLSFGQDQALERYHSALISAAGNASTVDDACLWEGLELDLTIDGKDVTLVGKPDFETCRNFMKTELLGLDTYCAAEPCAIVGEYMPDFPEDVPLYAFNGFFHTAEFFDIPLVSDVTKLNSGAAAYCDNDDWEAVKAKNPDTPEKYLYYYCANAGYYYSLLKFGYEYEGDVHYVETINGTDAGWPLGAMIYEAELLQLSFQPSGPDWDAYDWGLMVDAGSSGTRIYVYTWPRRHNSDVPQVQCAPWNDLEECWNFKNDSAPISGFVSNPEDSLFLIQQLVDFGKEKVPESHWGETPIYIKATAGMRLAVEQDSNATDTLMETIRDYLSDSTISPFKFERDWALVLPGEDEGAFGWISVNYMLGHLHADDTDITGAALDLGGASTQVSFVPSEPSMDHYYPLQVATESVPLYTHSYLSYGQDQSLKRYRESLLSTNVKQGDSVNDPCNFEGSSWNYTTEAGLWVMLTGTGNFEYCLTVITNVLLLPDTYCSASPCAINGVYMPEIPSDMPIYAFSGFSYTTAFFGLVGATEVSDVKTVAKGECTGTSWADIIADNPDIKEKYLIEYCFVAGYIFNLLHDAYGLNETTSVIFGDSINGTDIGWTLGSMVYEAGLMDIKIKPSEPSDLIYWIIGVTSAVVLGGLLFFYYKRSQTIEQGNNGSVNSDEEIVGQYIAATGDYDDDETGSLI